jgi:predicted RNA binding protein YcfA (HicA-like mRNA interferase family)
MRNMWIFNTIKFKIIEKFILSIWYEEISQEGSHIKYQNKNNPLIIPNHKEISRWTLNNIFKIISSHKKIQGELSWKDKREPPRGDKKEIEKLFLEFYKK